MIILKEFSQPKGPCFKYIVQNYWKDQIFGTFAQKLLFDYKNSLVFLILCQLTNQLIEETLQL